MTDETPTITDTPGSSTGKAGKQIEEPDVVVVGAGPVGLSLALGLARQHRRVLVVEKKHSTAEYSRAPAIWPATQEVLSRLGVIDRLLEQGLCEPSIALEDAETGKPLLTVPLEELSKITLFPHLLILPQSDTEALLVESLAQYPNAEIRFGTELLALAEDTDRVTATCQDESGETRISSRLLVGCDGAHSRVRELLAIDFPGNTFPFEASLADIRFASDNWHSPRLTTSPRLAIGIRISSDTWRLILPFTDDQSITLDDRIEFAVNSLFEDSGIVLWKSEFSLHNRVASTFSSGRVALAGDAAHLNSPVGGQGMNAGIQDTEPLVAAIVRALDEDNVSALTEFSTRRRRQVARNVNRFTTGLTRVIMFRRGRHLKLILRVANTLLKIRPLRRRFLRRMAMLK